MRTRWQVAVVLIAVTVGCSSGDGASPSEANGASPSEANKAVARCLEEFSRAPPDTAFFAHLANVCESSDVFEQALTAAKVIPEPMLPITIVRMSCLPQTASRDARVCRDLRGPADADAAALDDRVTEGCLTLMTAVMQWIEIVPGDPVGSLKQAADVVIAAGPLGGPSDAVTAGAHKVRDLEPSDGKSWGRAVDEFMEACADAGFRSP